MTTDEAKQLIESKIQGSNAIVSSQGDHFQLVVVSDEFENKSNLDRQKAVYQVLGDKITKGEIHAVTIKTYTSNEWLTIEKNQST